MSDGDSFIEEVADEVRRDRLYGAMRRYGWIAVVVVLAIVGGAAFNEWRKADAARAAEATGDAMLSALQRQTPEARAEALAGIDAPSPGAAAVAALLRAAELGEAGETAAAADTLASVGGAGDLPDIYARIAAFKALLRQGDALPVEERRLRYEALAEPGNPLRLLAEEQLALIDAEQGDQEAAIARLEAVREDAEAGAGLRRRATQLIVALGGTPRAFADG